MTTVTISLPNQIAKTVDAETKNQGFASRSEFIRNLLRKYFTSAIREDLVFQTFQSKPLRQVRSAFEKTGKYNKQFIDSLIHGLSQSSAYANKASK